MSKLLLRKKAPVCLHVLGQPLVNELHAEGRELFEAARDLLAHHAIRDLAGTSDTLEPRLIRLREAVCDGSDEVQS